MCDSSLYAVQTQANIVYSATNQDGNELQGRWRGQQLDRNMKGTLGS